MSATLTADIIQKDKQSVWHHLLHHQQLEQADPMVIVSGQGLTVTDINGKEYLDAVSGGVWTVNVGYGRQRIADAVAQQLVQLPFFSGSAGTIPGAEFANELTKLVPYLDRVYYSSSGSEANEKAYKMVRQRAHALNGGKKHKIIYRDRDYHGTTIAALSSTGQLERKAQYGPYVDGFVEMPNCSSYRNPFPGEDPLRCATILEDIILREGPDTVGAVVLEPITAGGGVIIPPDGYFQVIREICDRYGVLLHIDEVVCGMGRTGRWFGHQHFDVKPDLLAMAKGVASGYAAISVTMTTSEVFDVFNQSEDKTTGFFRDISTFGGCTAGPAAGLENLRIIQEENLVENSRIVGDYLKDQLLGLQEKYHEIGDVRGMGLFAGIELVNDRKTKEPCSEEIVNRIKGLCMKQGVMIGSSNRSMPGLNNTLLLSPPLICSNSDIDVIVEAMDQAMAQTFASA